MTHDDGKIWMLQINDEGAMDGREFAPSSRADLMAVIVAVVTEFADRVEAAHDRVLSSVDDGVKVAPRNYLTSRGWR